MSKAWLSVLAIAAAVAKPLGPSTPGAEDASGPSKGRSALNEVEARNRAAVEATFDAWRDGKASPFDLLAEDARWTIVGRSEVAGTYVGRAEFLERVIGPFNARMRDPLRPASRTVYTDGDTVVVLFDAAGVARDGQVYANTYAWFLEMRDGRVIDARAFFDSIAFDDLWRRVPPAGPGR